MESQTQRHLVVSMSSMARLLHLSAQQNDLLAMVIAYLDESYDNKVLIVAGWVAEASEWTRIEREWASVVNENSIDRYHAADCSNGFGEFRDWPVKRRTGLVKRLIKILTSGSMYGACSGLKVDDYEAIVPDAARQIIGAPYHLCFQTCVGHIAQRAEDLPIGEKIDFVLDRNQQFGGNATNLFSMMSDDRSWKHHGRLGTIAFAPAKDFLPLQAADLLAYESFKLLRAKLFEPWREIRKSMDALFALPLDGQYYDQGALVALLRGHNFEPREQP